MTHRVTAEWFNRYRAYHHVPHRKKGGKQAQTELLPENASPQVMGYLCDDMPKEVYWPVRAQLGSGLLFSQVVL